MVTVVHESKSTIRAREFVLVQATNMADTPLAVAVHRWPYDAFVFASADPAWEAYVWEALDRRMKESMGSLSDTRYGFQHDIGISGQVQPPTPAMDDFGTDLRESEQTVHVMDGPYEGMNMEMSPGSSDFRIAGYNMIETYTIWAHYGVRFATLSR